MDIIFIYNLNVFERYFVCQANWEAHLCFAVLGRHVANTHALCGVTPKELHCENVQIKRFITEVEE